MAPQEIPPKACAQEPGTKQGGGQVAHGEELAVETGGRGVLLQALPFGAWQSLSWQDRNWRPLSLSLPLQKVAEKLREQSAEVSGTGERCGASTAETSSSGVAPPSAHWNAAQSLAKQGKARLSRKAN